MIMNLFSVHFYPRLRGMFLPVIQFIVVILYKLPSYQASSWIGGDRINNRYGVLGTNLAFVE